MILDILLVCVLLSICYSDWKYFKIPNYLVVCLLLIALPNTSLTFFYTFLVSISVLFLFVLAIEKIVGKPIFGMGDVKLISVFFLYIEPVNMLFIIWFAAIIALISAKVIKLHGAKIPFGVYLSIAFSLIKFNLVDTNTILNLI